MGIIVMKFGGGSVADSAGIREVADRAREGIVASGQPNDQSILNGILVVVSAMAGVTDSLFLAARAARDADLSVAKKVCADLLERHLAAARELSLSSSLQAEAEIKAIVAALDSRLQGVRLVGELSDRSMDEIAAAGERLSSILVAFALGAPCVDARTVLRTDSRFGRARADQTAIARLAAEQLRPLLDPGKIAVTQGYIGSDSLGSTTTLGRDGSDYSASLLGAALRASEIQIWTDVEGILTCDPHVVPQARTVELLGYEEAAELAA
ncbi:MAG TPA: aspartate kinase, partial [Rectinemataceae bacterium]|nr:aspartate kinase [Rectinemataceae bacterium]